jgi:uncharacterized repeat protein (TIGR03803 family)
MALAAFAFAMLITATGAAAQTEAVLYGFNSNGVGGDYPAGVVMGASGNLYGTTLYGGSGSCPQFDGGCGTVFELTPNGSGGWTKRTLHNFAKNGKDGFFPTTGLVFDKAGNLYGTTQQGGTHHYGTVYELTPQANGNWIEKILHNFSYNGTDGTFPKAGVVFDKAGNLYGTTFEGGSFSCSPFLLGCGTVFELAPASEGKVWTETILHNFANNGTDGNTPCCGELVLDGAGDLYGVTGAGGTNNYGAVFELTPTGGGNWTETVLHSFSSGTGDGYFPQGGLTLDGKGNLYGTTVYGGAYGYGTVFELTPAGGGSWTEAIIHSFEQTISGTDGSVPSSDLVIDSAGNLYGTAGDGLYSLGVVFELSPAAGASWSEAILHNFQQTIPGTDGYTPGPMLVFDGSGNLYGTTYYGGADNGGTVFELTP